LHGSFHNDTRYWPVNFEQNELIRKHFKGKFSEIRIIKSPYGEIGEIMYHVFEDVNFWVNTLSGVTLELKSYENLTTEEDFYNE